MPDYLPWKNSWFQISVFAVIFSACLLLADCMGIKMPNPMHHTTPNNNNQQTQNDQNNNQQNQNNQQQNNNPTSPDNVAQSKAAYDKGETAINNGNNDEAAQDFSQAISLDPNNADAYCELGRSYGNEGKYNDAIEQYTKAINLDPKNYVYLNNRGWVYNEIGNYNAALADLNQSIESNSNYALSFNNRGWTYLYLGNDAQALPDFERSLEIDPKNYDSYERAAWIMATSSNDSLRNGQKALSYIKQAGYATNWSTPASLNIMAAACAENGDYTDAVKWSEKYLSNSQLSQDDRDWGQRELACYRAGRPFRR